MIPQHIDIPEASLTVATYLKLVVPIITATGGVAAFAVKRALNGSTNRIKEIREDVKDIQNGVHGISQEQSSVRERLVRVETLACLFKPSKP